MTQVIGTTNGEKAVVSVSQGWKAVISLERSRLMYFGAADRDFNLLLAMVALSGGHDVQIFNPELFRQFVGPDVHVSPTDNCLP